MNKRHDCRVAQCSNLKVEQRECGCGAKSIYDARRQNSKSASVISRMITNISLYGGWNGVGLLALPHSMV
jgi:hypothetical protein